MSIKDQHRDPFLKAKMEAYSVDPPESVWKEVSASLPGGGKGRRMLILGLVAAASVALAVSLGIVLYQGPDLNEEVLTSESEQTIYKESRPEAEVPEAEVPEITSLEERVVAVMNEVQGETIDKPGVETGKPGKELALQSIPVAELSEDIHAGDSLAQEGEEPADTVIDQQDDGQFSDTLLLSDPLADLKPLEDMGVEEKKKATWTLGAAVTPLFSYRDVQDPPADPGAESGYLAYSGGIHVRYKPSSRFALETGLYYNKTGINIGTSGIQLINTPMDMVYGQGPEGIEVQSTSNSIGNIVTHSGDVYVNGSKESVPGLDAIASADPRYAESGITQHLEYLELPMNLRYTMVDRKLELQLIGGVSTNFLVNNYVSAEGQSSEIGYLTNIRTVNYAGNAGLGMIYHFADRISLSMEPRFRYFLNSVNDSTLPVTRPWSMGLYTGINIRF